MSNDNDGYRTVQVRSAAALTPNMIRVVLGGAGLNDFSSSGFADERVGIAFTGANGTVDDSPVRAYTVRRWDADARELTVDLVRHDGGVAARWAEQARPGDVVQIGEPLGWYAPPADCAWQLLVADMTGLPALGRILEELPATTRAHAIVETIDSGDWQMLQSAAPLAVDWHAASGHGLGPSVLARAVRDFEFPEGPGYVWFAGEAAESRSIRKFLRRELGWSVDRFEVLGYWRVRKEAWMARYETVSAEIEQVYAKAIADGRDTNEALELYDAALEKVGL